MLPREVSLADVFNEFMKQRIVDFEKSTKVNHLNHSPVRIYENADHNRICILETPGEPTLDIYGSRQNLVTHVQKIPDSKTAWTLKRNAKLLVDLANTKAKKLEAENK